MITSLKLDSPGYVARSCHNGRWCNPQTSLPGDDRLGRSLPDLLDLLRELHSKNVDLLGVPKTHPSAVWKNDLNSMVV
jgi:hypothetical protein